MKIPGINEAVAAEAVSVELLPEGNHIVEVKIAREQEAEWSRDPSTNPDAVVLYLFLTAPKHAGVHVSLPINWGSRIKQLCDALGISTANDDVDIDDMVGRQVVAVIKHKVDRNGVKHANAIAFERVTAEAEKAARQTVAVKAASDDSGDVPF